MKEVKIKITKNQRIQGRLHQGTVICVSEWQRVTLNFFFFCLHFLNASITGLYHCSQMEGTGWSTGVRGSSAFCHQEEMKRLVAIEVGDRAGLQTAVYPSKG